MLTQDHKEKLEQLHGRMSDLQAIGHVFNRDACTDLITEIEERLTKTGVGVEVWLDTNDHWIGHNDPELYATDTAVSRCILGYMSLDSTWRIAVRELLVMRDDDQRAISTGTARPLLHASQTIQLAAVPLLASLLDAMILRAKQIMNARLAARSTWNLLKPL